jgi:uncharacterized membrane protein YgaE (UPF0421/DUF939 family)
MENNKPDREHTSLYMILTLILASILMFTMHLIFGSDGAIISGILMLIVLASAIRYEM